MFVWSFKAVHLCDILSFEVQRESTWALASWQPRRHSFDVLCRWWLADRADFFCYRSMFGSWWVEWLKNLSVKGAKLQQKNRSSHRQTPGRKGEGRGNEFPSSVWCIRQGTNPPAHQRYHGQSKSDGPSWKGFVGVTWKASASLVYLSLHFVDNEFPNLTTDVDAISTYLSWIYNPREICVHVEEL